MATYAVGDIQGCLTPLKKLLSMVLFDPKKDMLWLVGDLVNRGPHSLHTLLFLRDLGECVKIVLGNHDLHFLKLASGAGTPSPSDTLNEVLRSRYAADLAEWLRTKPIFHKGDTYSMVHAGILPQWSLTQAESLAKEVQEQLSGKRWRSFLRNVYGNEPNKWRNSLSGITRSRVIINAFTRMRICSLSGAMNFAFKQDKAFIPKDFYAWFDVPRRKTEGDAIIFGHWSALGLLIRNNVIGLDSGCVWGRSLTAVRLEDRKVFQTNCLAGMSDSAPQL